MLAVVGDEDDEDRNVDENAVLVLTRALVEVEVEVPFVEAVPLPEEVELLYSTVLAYIIS